LLAVPGCSGQKFSRWLLSRISGLDYGLISGAWDVLAVIPEQPAISQRTASASAVPQENSQRRPSRFLQAEKEQDRVQKERPILP